MSQNHKNLMIITSFLIVMVTNNNGFDVHSEITNSLLSVFKNYFEENSSLLITYDHPNHTKQKLNLTPNLDADLREVIIKAIMESNELTLQISSGEVKAFNEDFPATRLDNALIFLCEHTILDEEIFQDELGELRLNPLWYPYGRVVIVLEKTDEKTDNKEWSRRVIDKFWKYTKNDDMLVLIPNISKGIEFYTWFPYHPPDCSEVKHAVYLDSWIDGKFELGVDLYPEKVTTDLQGCDFLMVTSSCIPYVIPDYYDQTKFSGGIEIKIIQALSKAMHFNIKLIPAPSDFWITTTEDNKVAGAFKLLSDQDVDLAFSCMMLNFERYYLAEPLPSYFDDSLIWLIPTPNLKSHVYDLFKAFPIPFWLSILITLISSTFVIILIVHCESKYNSDQKLSSISYMVKMIGMSVYTSVVFKTNSNLLRAAIAIFLLYSMHITTAFQASLFGLFRTPAFDKAYQTLQEAVDAGLYVYLRESTKGMYNQSDHEVWNKILQPGRYEYLNDYEIAFDRIAGEKSAIALYIKSTGMYIISGWYTNDFGQPKILNLRDRFTSYPVTMYMSPGSPLFPVFESMIYNLIASGLVDYWSRTAIEPRYNNPNRFKTTMERALGLEHFSGAIFVLFCLLILAFLIFLAEILYHKFCGKKCKDKNLLFKIKIDRELVRRKRKENAIHRSNWFLTKPTKVPGKIDEFFLHELNKKKNSDPFFSENIT